jgi:hypothetical protein
MKRPFPYWEYIGNTFGIHGNTCIPRAVGKLGIQYSRVFPCIPVYSRVFPKFSGLYLGWGILVHWEYMTCTWEYMGIHGNTWEYMGIHVFPGVWEYMGIHGNTWEYMGIHGNTRIPRRLGIHGNTVRERPVEESLVLCQRKSQRR